MDFTASIPLPFTKRLINTLERWFYLKHYEESHAHYLKWNGRSDQWEITESLTAIFSIQDMMSNSKNPCSKLVLHNSSRTHLKNVRCTFHAESGDFIYQQDVCVDIPPGKAAIESLTNIPLDSCSITEDGKLRASISNYHLVVHDMIQDDIPIVLNKTSSRRSLTHSWFTYSTWVPKWGTNWNLDLIEQRKEDLMIETDYKYVKRYHLFLPWQNNLLPYLRHPSLIFKRPLCWLLNKKPVLSMRFWILLKCGFISLSTDS